eukprot:GABW01001217.1.p2 GENE.GABW01001217.1~~GABW01001217.1.p2  ORF type:complete len:55 (+),score=2.46 GABW01001217.1:135-299(+)
MLNLVMEYVPGTLSSLVQRMYRHHSILPAKFVAIYGYQLLLAMEYNSPFGYLPP